MLQEKNDSLVKDTTSANIEAASLNSGFTKVISTDTIESNHINPQTFNTNLYTLNNFGDTLFPSLSKSCSIKKETFFQSQIVGEDFTPHNKQISSSLLSIPVMVFTVYLFSYIKFKYPKKIEYLAISFFTNRFSKTALDEEKLGSTPLKVSQVLLFLLSHTLFFTLCVLVFDIQRTTFSFWGDFGLIFLGLSSLFLLKFLAVKLSEILFKQPDIFSEYLHHTNTINFSVSVLILPFIILSVLATFISPSLSLIITSCMLFSGYLFRFLKLLYLGILTTPISGFYIILYICALELLPLLVLGKLLLYKS